MEFIGLGLLILIVILAISIKFDLYHLTHRRSGERRRILIDTSALIDGRILSLARTGFIGDELVIPRSVVGELQLLADGSDPEKRSRARFGLDVVAELQKIDGLIVTILQDSASTPEGVDNRLLELAKKGSYLLLTLDFNLNKVAKIERISVLNINELAQTLRMQLLPGEATRIKLTQAGSNDNQAVGYLPDGTMVVVADARKLIGRSVEVEATRTIQTEAGKMLFAKLKHGSTKQNQSDRKTNQERKSRGDSNKRSNPTSINSNNKNRNARHQNKRS